MPSCSRDRKQGTHTVVSRGGKCLLCDPGSELREGWSWRGRANILNRWDGKV